jgi:CRP-like cAMP-binding protein/predicted GNAT family N-acyltransferase
MDSVPTLTETFIDPDAVAGLCPEVSFAPGDVLRRKGLHYKSMYLLTDGEVEIALEKKGTDPTILTRQRGSPIGEISFLTGRPATANVKACTPTKALVINDDVWAMLEREHPTLAAGLYRQLAEVADGRQSFNLLFHADASGKPPEANVEVRLCRNAEMLREAQRIRYEVYCEELGRTSPFADPENRIIADELDTFAHVLIALHGEEPVGTMRLNRAAEGPLGPLVELYGMQNSSHHPGATSVCTKFIVRKAHRYSQASFKLMATSMEVGMRSKVKESFIDCIPSLLPFYMSMGFRQSAPAFLHRENGRSIPLMLDVERYAPRINRLTGFVLR